MSRKVFLHLAFVHAVHARVMQTHAESRVTPGVSFRRAEVRVLVLGVEKGS